MPNSEKTKQITPKQMFTIQEAVKYFGISEYSIRMGIRQGRYPAIRVGGKRSKYLINAEQFKNVLEQEAMSNLAKTMKGESFYGGN